MRLNNKTIFILGATRFDGPYESTSFTTAKFLAKENKVYYIDYPYTWKDAITQRKNDQFNKRKSAFKDSSKAILATEIDNLKIVILPLLLSINFLPESSIYRFLLGINEGRIASRLAEIKEIHQLNDFIFINSFNFHYPGLIRKIGASLNIYHCVDPLVINYDVKHGIKSELEICKNVDVIFCTSKALFNEKIKINKNTFFIPNAADLQHSSRALNPNLAIHPFLVSIPKPIIGYFGNIERRMDFTILQEVVELNEDKSFVFAGPISDEYIPDAFKKNKNVFFIGRIPFNDMPSVIKGFDVCIIPFKKDQFSSTIFPLKLFEYLGAGRPVVSTNFNIDLEEFTKGTVPFSATSLEFSNHLNEAISIDTESKKDKRLEIAQENTWENRLDTFSQIINDFYQRKERTQ